MKIIFLQTERERYEWIKIKIAQGRTGSEKLDRERKIERSQIRERERDYIEVRDWIGRGRKRDQREGREMNGERERGHSRDLAS